METGSSLGIHYPRRLAARLAAAAGTSLLAAGRAQVANSQPAANQKWRIVALRDFGVSADGVNDDAPAINRAITFVRNQRHKITGPIPGFRIIFDGGIYLIKSPLNFTEINVFDVVIEGGGALLFASTNGRPAIDALGSRWLSFKDIYILGDNDSSPSIGIQIGRTQETHLGSSDNHMFENVSFNGSFSQACLYNFSSETTLFLHCFFWNKHPSAQAFCLIQDGTNSFGISSDFVEQNAPTNVAQSFNENLLVNCDFRRTSAAPALWLSSTARLEFQRCYSAVQGATACILDLAGQSHTMLSVDCHFEGPDLADVFLLTGAKEGQIQGFTYLDHTTPPRNSIFKCDPVVKSLEFQNTHIEAARFVHHSARVFDDPSVFRMSGSYYSAQPGTWNMPKQFAGTVCVGLKQDFYGTFHNAV